MPITDAMVEAAAKAIFQKLGVWSTAQKEAARAALTAALSQDEWQDAEANPPPKDGAKFLAVYPPIFEPGFVFIAFWNAAYDCFTDEFDFRVIPKKWCCIPPIPTQEEG